MGQYMQPQNDTNAPRIYRRLCKVKLVHAYQFDWLQTTRNRCSQCLRLMEPLNVQLLVSTYDFVDVSLSSTIRGGTCSAGTRLRMRCT